MKGCVRACVCVCVCGRVCVSIVYKGVVLGSCWFSVWGEWVPGLLRDAPKVGPEDSGTIPGVSCGPTGFPVFGVFLFGY